jgi:hypothetical protein
MCNISLGFSPVIFCCGGRGSVRKSHGRRTVMSRTCWPRNTGRDRGASLIEVLVAISLLAAAVLLLGSGATLWQVGLRWPAERFEMIHGQREDLSRWPAHPLVICGDGDPEDWWTHISQSGRNEWSVTEIWVTGYGWMEASGATCAEIPVGTVSAIKVRGPHLETVLLVSRT